MKNKNYFVNLTGNPFVDSGMWALSRLAEKNSPENLTIPDLKKAKREIMSLYFKEGWKKTLYSVFTTNCKILNPSPHVDNEKEYRIYLEDLIDKISKSKIKKEGSCIGCGRRDFEDRITNTNIPLTGSGSHLNYFSYLAQGADYCPACTFSIQFSPLVMYSAYNILLLHSQSEKIMKYASKKPLRSIREQKLTNNYTGCYDTNIKNPINSLFSIIVDILNYREENWYDEKPAIQFYHFTNYGQSPGLEIFHIPDQVFKFLALVKKHQDWDKWFEVVRHGYINVNMDNVEIENKYKNKINLVYKNLLGGKSIVGYFLDLKNERIYGTWKVLELYLSEVRNMEKERIETIKEVGDKIAQYIKDSNDLKRLNKIERVDTYRGFRNQLRILIKNRINSDYEDNLFSFDEYIKYLVPDYKLWRETQDLLLFRIYEQTYDWLHKTAKNENIENEKVI